MPVEILIDWPCYHKSFSMGVNILINIINLRGATDENKNNYPFFRYLIDIGICYVMK